MAVFILFVQQYISNFYDMQIYAYRAILQQDFYHVYKLYIMVNVYE